MTARCRDRALVQREFRGAQWKDRIIFAEQNRDGEMVLQQTRRLDRPLILAIDQGRAFARQSDDRHIGRGFAGRGEQCRDLRSCGFGVL